VFVPERHDLGLSNAVRCHEGDLRCIEQIHQRHPLDRAVLVDRFVTEMAHAIGGPKRLVDNFVLCIERLLGDVAAGEVEASDVTYGAASSGRTGPSGARPC
jgi:hypothetical protein